MPNLFPSSTTLPAVATSPQIAQPTVVWGVAPLFDYSQNKLLFDDSNEMILGDEATTLSQRIVAMLSTPRTRWRIYSPYFGSDFWAIWGRSFLPEILNSLTPEFVRRAVRDDRITNLSNFVVTVVGKSVTCQFTITTVSGFRKQFEGKWSV